MRRFIRILPLAATLALAGSSAAWGKDKKRKNSSSNKTVAPRLYIYDPDHAAGPPEVLQLGNVAEAKFPNAPLMNLREGPASHSKEGVEPEDLSVTEKAVTPDEGAGVKKGKKRH